jgi:hypothetical protein
MITMTLQVKGHSHQEPAGMNARIHLPRRLWVPDVRGEFPLGGEFAVEIRGQVSTTRKVSTKTRDIPDSFS